MNDRRQYVVEVGPANETLEWGSLDEAATWLQTQLDKWSWTSGGMAASLAQNQVWGVISTTLGDVRTKFNHAKIFSQSAPGNSDEVENFREGALLLKRAYEEHPWLSEQSPAGKFIADVRRRKGDAVASGVLAIWMNLSFNSDNHPYFVAQAVAESEFYARGGPDRLAWEEAEYANILQGITRSRDTMAALQEGLRQQVEEQTKAFSSEKSARAMHFSTEKSTRDEQWKQQVDDATQKLKQIERAYREHMSLAAPVEYWEKKKIRHFRWMVATGLVTISAMGLAGWLLHCELTEVGQAASAAASSAKAASGAAALGKTDGVMALLTAATTWRLGSFILLATLAFWVLRLLVRIFLSNMHLENDAAERVTMVKTYLALISEGKLNGDSENLKAVLAALFRPTGDGIVKDEGIPPNVLELLTKLK
ncbi:DUF6161 domain-containing protein [uncultured Aquabacterium sp.]|uniref:DUF6161 domain-containing protein n=1 Tax=uncultured Aquabacterium sp. TaxID=158753 RepID=UPI00262AFFD9|nr:DUF6161 domain-containing protein [uncultured Aquabacterium sp.]